MFPVVAKDSVSVHHDLDRKAKPYVVRWQQDGRERNKAFATEEEALTFDRSRQSPADPPLDELAAHRAQLARMEACITEPPPEAPDQPAKAEARAYRRVCGSSPVAALWSKES